MHSLELVHTDIKPENICLVNGEDLKGRPCTPASCQVYNDDQLKDAHITLNCFSYTISNRRFSDSSDRLRHRRVLRLGQAETRAGGHATVPRARGIDFVVRFFNLVLLIPKKELRV